MLNINLVLKFLLPLAILLSNSPSSHAMMPSEQFFFRYLDDWIGLINQTMETISPVKDGEDHSNSVSDRCYGHMTYLMEAGRGRKPWALKSKFFHLRTLPQAIFVYEIFDKFWLSSQIDLITQQVSSKHFHTTRATTQGSLSLCYVLPLFFVDSFNFSDDLRWARNHDVRIKLYLENKIKTTKTHLI